MPIVTLLSGAQFDADAGASILDSAERAKVILPYSCKTGRCSSCKCKVVSGETIVLRPEAGLSEEEKLEGWVLSCVREAETDVVLEVDDLGGIALPSAKTLPCRINRLELLSPDVIQVQLRLPPTAVFSFIPGQYIEVIGPSGIRRSYSLANASCADKVLELHIRAVDAGVMSEYWFNLAKVNDLLRLHGPLGTFVLRETVGVDLYFLATGTGIAPVKAMMESFIDRPLNQRPRSITVYWGGRSPSDLYFDVSRVPIEHTFEPVLSRANESWEGSRGYVQQALLKRNPDFSNALVYACGSDAMIRSAKELLVQSGLSANRFYSDAFVCSSS